MINLANFSDEEIIEMGVCLLVSTLLAFKHKHDKEFVLKNPGKVFIFVNAKGLTQEELARFFRVFLLYLFRAFSFENAEVVKITEELPKMTQPVFESTYDRLIHEGEIKGEAIGIEKGKAIGEETGERKRSLEIVLDSLLLLPALGNSEVARLAKLPEAFVSAMRECLVSGNLRRAQQIAAGLFADLQGFSNEDVKKVKKIVRDAWKRQPGS